MLRLSYITWKNYGLNYKDLDSKNKRLCLIINIVQCLQKYTYADLRTQERLDEMI